jgi:SAM-dependent methyltransferase
MSSENDEQKQFWEEVAQLWVTQQTDLDGLLAPVLSGVLDRAALRPGQRVLDIGCGAGTSTVEAARLVGPDGHVTGADISEPMLKRARELAHGAQNIDFVSADAAYYPFAPETFDQVISRFGVMFFVDSVLAFVNIRKAMKPAARLTMACWSHLDQNPWFRVPMYAAKARVGAPPPLEPDAPGPLAFRDIDRVTGILQAAGFNRIEASAEALFLTPPGDLTAVASHASRLGPAARAMTYFEASESDVAAIENSVAREFEQYMTPDGARVPAKINFFTAYAPDQPAT